MQNDLNEVLNKARSDETRSAIKEILDLDISILTKHLVIYDSFNRATEIISKLLPGQKKMMKQELAQINIGKYN
jgi:hypothetical protein